MQGESDKKFAAFFSKIDYYYKYSSKCDFPMIKIKLDYIFSRKMTFVLRDLTWKLFEISPKCDRYF